MPVAVTEKVADSIRQALANNLRAVVAQKLVKGLKKGRVPTNEIMIVNPTIRKLIIEGSDSKIPDAIRIGYQEGMTDFTENLRDGMSKRLRGSLDTEIPPTTFQYSGGVSATKTAAR